jgi:hypothetical protein
MRRYWAVIKKADWERGFESHSKNTADLGAIFNSRDIIGKGASICSNIYLGVLYTVRGRKRSHPSRALIRIGPSARRPRTSERIVSLKFYIVEFHWSLLTFYDFNKYRTKERVLCGDLHSFLCFMCLSKRKVSRTQVANETHLTCIALLSESISALEIVWKPDTSYGMPTFEDFYIE